MKAQCQNCQFAKSFNKPKPMDPPKTVSMLWGLIKYTEEPNPFIEAYHQLAEENYEYRILCCRYPDMKEKRKTGCCGEFIQRGEQP